MQCRRLSDGRRPRRRLLYRLSFPFSLFPFFLFYVITMPVAERNNHWTVRLKILRESDDNISFDATYFPGTYFGIYVREVGKTSGNPHYHLAMSFDKPKTNKQVTAMILKSFHI